MRWDNWIYIYFQDRLGLIWKTKWSLSTACCFILYRNYCIKGWWWCWWCDQFLLLLFFIYITLWMYTLSKIHFSNVTFNEEYTMENIRYTRDNNSLGLSATIKIEFCHLTLITHLVKKRIKINKSKQQPTSKIYQNK